MELVLVRLTTDLGEAQRGVLMMGGEPFCVTLELPWRDNFHNISCIPEGTYPMRERSGVTTLDGMDLPRTFEVLEVPDRSGILFHPGNDSRDTRGCILLGNQFAVYAPMILESKLAFGNFLSALDGVSEATLRIRHI